MPKHKISPPTRFFPHKERYEIFDDENLVEKFKIFVQDFVPIRTALRDDPRCSGCAPDEIFQGIFLTPPETSSTIGEGEYVTYLSPF